MVPLPGFMRVLSSPVQTFRAGSSGQRHSWVRTRRSAYTECLDPPFAASMFLPSVLIRVSVILCCSVSVRPQSHVTLCTHAPRFSNNRALMLVMSSNQHPPITFLLRMSHAPSDIENINQHLLVACCSLATRKSDSHADR